MSIHVREHSHEEVRAAALDVISGRVKTHWEYCSQFEELALAIAQVLSERDGVHTSIGNVTGGYSLYPTEAESLREIFWDFFRQGIVTLGLDAANPNFPFFRVSKFGKRLIERNDTYFFHDVSSYAEVIKTEIPNINEVTLLYLQEAMQAFQTGCLLSATVMLGVATEHTFLLLLEAVVANPTNASTFKNASEQRTILQKVNKFKNVLDQNLSAYPDDIKEDLDTHFAGILSVIRGFRNQAGHPTGKIPSREQVYVLLHLFIPYCRKLYDMMKFYRKNRVAPPDP